MFIHECPNRLAQRIEYIYMKHYLMRRSGVSTNPYTYSHDVYF